MLISQIQQKVLDEGAQLIRPRKDWQKGEPKEYDVKPLFTGNKHGWIMLDLFTANAMNTCYAALGKLNEQHKQKWDTIPVWKLVDFTWDHVS